MDLDHDAFTVWMAGEAMLRRKTIDDCLQKLRRLERDGFNGRTFLTSPDHARLEVRRMRAKLRMDGVPDNTIRHSEVVWNRVAAWAATMDRRFEGVRWDLTPEVRGMPKTITEQQADLAMQYRFPDDELVEKRRRALIWLMENLGWRKSEIEGLRVQDLDPTTGRIYMANPAKGRGPMWWPLPRDAFSPKRPVQAWLAVRPVPEERPDAFWTFRVARHGVGAYKDLGCEITAISKQLGFRIGFTRCRRYDTQRLDEANVHPRIIQKKRNHAKLDTTMRYMGEVTIERAEKELAKKGAPGFRAATRKRKPKAEPKADVPKAIEIVETELQHVQVGIDVGASATGPESDTTSRPELRNTSC